MLRMTRYSLVALLVLLLAGCGNGPMQPITPPPPPGPPPALALTNVVSGLTQPVDLQFPPDNSGRLFVVEQAGTIRIVSTNVLLPGNFLDIRSKVAASGEKGLLGLAFHPNFSSNRRFFVNYTRSAPPGSMGIDCTTVIAEYQVSALDANQADPTERILFTVDQPFANHNGGQLAFGNDGFLYIGLGDGGGGGDPNGNGQNTNTLLGKMLRIDVDSAQPYAVPPDNPFVGAAGLDEIWAYGFRNPWRFSFERSSGRLFVADVGQGNYEEIDIVTKGGNFGWKTMEGTHCFSPASGCNMTGLVLPINEYDHSQGDVAVIGGYIYTGTAIQSLSGAYIFGDFGSGRIWSLRENPPNTWTRTELLNTGRSISSFGQDAGGELYVADHGGAILKLVTQ